MKNFEYIRPDNLNDVLYAFKDYKDARLLAGGTDLLVGMKSDFIKPGCIIDLKSVPSISDVERRDEWSFGALATVRDIEVSETLQEKMPFLCKAAGELSSIQIRNRATLGGNLCHASPAADMAAMLLAMDSKARIVSLKGEKTVPLDDFFTGPNSTIIADGDILTEIVVPREVEQSNGIYMKFGPRKAMDIGVVNIAILLEADPGTRLCKKIRIAMGAAAPTPIRAKQAEELLNGRTLNPDLIERAARAASDETNPISDFRASAAYRKELVKVLVSKGVNKLIEA
ncbi:MAG: xanthine dehydrogenase family protein subunit M [Desulfobacterales bacterium]|nr:xanthine dehydrogenase family protein subunit M [Desulfobacterales bacterium]